MGFFSWITGDTKESISNAYSTRGALPVNMILPDGTVLREENYDGYGIFGGRDIYAEIARINAPSQCTGDTEHDRSLGIEIIFKDNDSGSFEVAEKNGIKTPRLAENETEYNKVPPSENCPEQGYFYEEDYDEE